MRRAEEVLKLRCAVRRARTLQRGAACIFASFVGERIYGSRLLDAVWIGALRMPLGREVRCSGVAAAWRDGTASWATGDGQREQRQLVHEWGYWKSCFLQDRDVFPCSVILESDLFCVKYQL